MWIATHLRIHWLPHKNEIFLSFSLVQEAKLFPMTHLILFVNLTVSELCQSFILSYCSWKTCCSLGVSIRNHRIMQLFGQRIANPSGQISFGYTALQWFMDPWLFSRGYRMSCHLSSSVVLGYSQRSRSVLAIKVFPCSLLSGGQKKDGIKYGTEKKSGRWNGCNNITFNENLCSLCIVFIVKNYWFT